MSPLKTNARVGIPQDKEAASSLIAQIGANERNVARIEADMNDAIAKIKETAFKQAEPFRSHNEQLTEAVQSYCEANRKTLTGDGKTKTVDFGVGKTSWRAKNAKVNVEGDEDAIVASLGRSGNPDLVGFLREKMVLDRVALLRNPALAETVAGISIEKGGETFEVKPDKAKVPETSKAEAAE